MSLSPAAGRQVSAYLQLVRLPGTFSAWSNVLAAHLIATQGSPHWGQLALHLLASTAFYWAGMALNDCFDQDEDRRERPGRPIPSGRVPVRTAWGLGLGLLALGVALAVLGGGAGAWVGVALAAAILAYDGLLKGGPLGPLTMGLCRGLNWLLGLSAAPLHWGSAALVAPVALYTAGVTALSGSETRGVEGVTLIAALAYLGGAFVALLALIFAGPLPLPLASIPALAAALALGMALRRMAAQGDPAAVQAMVRTLLLAMIPLDALLLLGSGLWVPALALPLLLVPGLLLARRLYLT